MLHNLGNLQRKLEQTDRQTDRQKERKAERQSNRRNTQTNSQTEKGRLTEHLRQLKSQEGEDNQCQQHGEWRRVVVLSVQFRSGTEAFIHGWRQGGCPGGGGHKMF